MRGNNLCLAVQYEWKRDGFFVEGTESDDEKIVGGATYRQGKCWCQYWALEKPWIGQLQQAVCIGMDLCFLGGWWSWLFVGGGGHGFLWGEGGHVFGMACGMRLYVTWGKEQQWGLCNGYMGFGWGERMCFVSPDGLVEFAIWLSWTQSSSVLWTFLHYRHSFFSVCVCHATRHICLHFCLSYWRSLGN